MNRGLIVTLAIVALVAADEINFPSGSFRSTSRPSGIVNNVQRKHPVPQNPAHPQAGSGPSEQGSFLAAQPMLGFALKLGDCRTSSAFDCNSNTVFSPLSISTTLTMLMIGTNGNCSRQLRKVLRYKDNAGEDGINSAFRFILNRMKELDAQHKSAIILNVANGLFSQNALRPEFETKARNFFLSDVKQLDLKGNGYGAANVINNWVSEKTNKKINNILFSLPPDTRLVAANAVYLNANWADPFNPENTSNLRFTVRYSETINAPAMFQHANVGYVEDAELGCQMIAKPYKGEELGMFILLPTERNGIDSLNKLEQRLDEFVFEQLYSRMETKTVAIQLPKFQIKQRINLKNPLKSLGVVDLFSPETADLSRMVDRKDLALDDIIHQTYIDVTESGTEAAAATVISLSREGPSKRFTVDNPFLFFIIHIESRAILFSGRVVKPITGNRN